MSADTPPFRSGGGLRLAIFLTVGAAFLVAIFYAVENWRGKRAWQSARKQLEAKGAQLDWNVFIPPPVPDDQNVFKAPHMTEWFVRKTDPAARGQVLVQGGPPPTLKPAAAVCLARIVLSPASAASNGAGGIVLDSEAPAFSADLRSVLMRECGRVVEGAQGLVFAVRNWETNQPVELVLVSRGGSAMELVRGRVLGAASWVPGAKPFLENTGPDGFLLKLNFPNSFCTAADYLGWSGQFADEFAAMRLALQRPHARMDGDYTVPFRSPIADFVALRKVGQTLAQRAQCYLLLGDPDGALHELTLLRQLSRMLQPEPSAQPTTLVSAMIDVALTGLYVSVIAEGFEADAWREPHLRVIHDQAAGIDLLPGLARALEVERAGVARLLSTPRPGELAKAFDFSGARPPSWRRFLEPDQLLLRLGPRGWQDQNRALVALLEQEAIEAIDLTNRTLLPSQQNKAAGMMGAALRKTSPYNWMAMMAVPNFTKAAQNLGRTQSAADQLALVCLLERFRIDKGIYPEELAALVPEYARGLPHDVIGGEALRYRRVPDGRFLLYSIGWNEQDDAGNAGPKGTGLDWVWPEVVPGR